MPFEDELRALFSRRRDPLSQITGFSGGNLRDQLDRRPPQQPQRFMGAMQGEEPLPEPERLTSAPVGGVSALSAMPPPPPAPVFNPIVYDKGGYPSVSPTAQGRSSSILGKEYEALSRYQPQKKGNRFLSALQSAGLSIAANYRPGQRLGETLGQGLGGLATGAITDKPGYYKRNLRLGQVRGELGDALQLDRAGLQEELIRSQIEENKAQARRPAAQPPGFTLGEGQVRYDASGKQLATGPNKAAPYRAPLPQADEQGNSYYADAITGRPLTDESGGVRYRERVKPEKPDETPHQRLERQRQYASAKQRMSDLSEQEKKAEADKNRAWQEYQAARARYKDNPDIQDDVMAAKKAYDEAERHYGSFWGKKNEAKADMTRYGETEMSATEQKIRDAAEAKGLDPDEAVRRYRSGKY